MTSTEKKVFLTNNNKINVQFYIFRVLIRQNLSTGKVSLFFFAKSLLIMWCSYSKFLEFSGKYIIHFNSFLSFNPSQENCYLSVEICSQKPVQFVFPTSTQGKFQTFFCIRLVLTDFLFFKEHLKMLNMLSFSSLGLRFLTLGKTQPLF